MFVSGGVTPITGPKYFRAEFVQPCSYVHPCMPVQTCVHPCVQLHEETFAEVDVSGASCSSAFAADGTESGGVAENGRADAHGAVYDQWSDCSTSASIYFLPCSVVVRRAMSVKKNRKKKRSR